MKPKTRKNKNKHKHKKSRKDGWHNPNLLMSSIQDITYFIRDFVALK